MTDQTDSNMGPLIYQSGTLLTELSGISDRTVWSDCHSILETENKPEKKKMKSHLVFFDNLFIVVLEKFSINVIFLQMSSVFKSKTHSNLI